VVVAVITILLGEVLRIGFGTGVLDDYWADYRRRCRESAARIRKAAPQVKVLMYYDSQRDTSEGGQERFRDSWLTDRQGNQLSTDWDGRNSLTYSNVPTLKNSYGRAMLAAVDPYLAAEPDETGLRIARAELAAVNGKFDLITMHHVLEHLAEPVAALTLARERLRAGGRILVRIPVAGSFAYREYGADSCHLDAPRHPCIPSVRGLNYLAQRAGLRVLHLEFDGTHLVFRMSDSYRRDIPSLQAPLWNRAIRAYYRRRAARLNREGEGDTGVFVLGVD